ncbi:MAG: hypothetical protein KF819_26795 [Labilithrix sp.]|nr:hypothetical protein [Labilithrix sp.]
MARTLAELRALGPELKTRASEIGHYIAALLSAFNLDPPPLSSPRPPPSRVDVKRHVFYGKLLRPSSTSDQALAMVFTALLSSTNFALHVLPVAAGREGPIESWFLFKWRLITLFHVGSSLRRVVANQQAKEVLRPEVLSAIVELRRASKHVQKLKPIRDALVHYGFGKPSKPTHETPLQRVTTFVQTDASLAESALGQISKVLTSLLPHVG